MAYQIYQRRNRKEMSPVNVWRYLSFAGFAPANVAAELRQ